MPVINVQSYYSYLEAEVIVKPTYIKDLIRSNFIFIVLKSLIQIQKYF